ncbi:hypothetical protein [Ulvibacterium sp.]
MKNKSITSFKKKSTVVLSKEQMNKVLGGGQIARAKRRARLK